MLTEQKKLFVQEYIKLHCKNQTEAAIRAGYSKKSASTQASDILKQSEVQEYLQEQKSKLEQEIRQEFLFDASEARKVMYQILMNEDARDCDRLNAARDFLDRAGFKAAEKMEVTGSIKQEQTKLDDILAQLRGGKSG